MSIAHISQLATQQGSRLFTKTKVIIAIALVVIVVYGTYRFFRTQPVDRTFEKVPAHLKTVRQYKPYDCKTGN